MIVRNKRRRRGSDSRAKTLLKLGVWAGILVWMVFYLAFGIVMAQKLSAVMYTSLLERGLDETFGRVLAIVSPIWLVFTVLMTCYLIAIWVNRVFRR